MLRDVIGKSNDSAINNKLVSARDKTMEVTEQWRWQNTASSYENDMCSDIVLQNRRYLK